MNTHTGHHNQEQDQIQRSEGAQDPPLKEQSNHRTAAALSSKAFFRDDALPHHGSCGQAEGGV